MALTISSASARLARNIQDTESQIAAAIAAAGTTMATLALAQVEVEGAPKGSTQLAMLKLQKTMTNLVAAQSDMLRTHSQLREIGREMMGPEEPWCPDDAAFRTAEADDHTRVA